MNRTLFCLVVASSLASFAQPSNVHWSAETSAIPANMARDPAILASADGGFLVLGTDSLQVGAYAYRSSGQLQQVLPLGPVIAADHRRGLTLIIGASGAVFAVVALEDGGLAQVTPSASVLSAGNVVIDDSPDGGLGAWFEANGQLKHYQVGLAGGFSLTADGTIALPQVGSGLTVDHRTGRLFVGQPTLGVWTIDDAGIPEWAASIDAGRLGAVVGGLELLELADGGAWLFEAAASDDAISLFSFQSVNHLLAFEGSVVVTAPDGGSARAASPGSLALFQWGVEQFPRGVMVVQDSFNANYKIVSLADVDQVIPLPPGPPRSDAGMVMTDGGTTVPDAGTRDGGGSIPGGGGGTGGHMTNPDFPQTNPCGCTTLEGLVALPALLLLWWIRRPSRSRS